MESIKDTAGKVARQAKVKRDSRSGIRIQRARKILPLRTGLAIPIARFAKVSVSSVATCRSATRILAKYKYVSVARTR